MFIKILFLTLVFILGFTTSESYEINYRNNGVDIIFHSIDYKSIDIGGGHYAFSAVNADGAIPNTSSTYQIPEIRLLLIIPDNANLSFKINSINEKLFNGELAFNPDKDKSAINIDKNISLKKTGNLRGVGIALLRIQPFSYIPHTGKVKAIQSIDISIDYGVELNRPQAIVDVDEWRFFSQVANPEHIFNILPERTKFSKSGYDGSLEADWYNPDIKYVKLTTTRDGIARAALSDIMTLFPELEGENPDYLHLIFNGVEYPVSYKDDGNGQINDADFFYFMGRRPYADTTWFANYTGKAPFFLYYDENNRGKRFERFPLVEPPFEKIASVSLYKHIEQEKIYHRGFPQEPSETQPGEGWFWEIISPSLGWIAEYKDTLFVLPGEDNSDLNLTFQFASCIWDPYHEDIVAHILQTGMNNHVIKQDSFMVRARDSVQLNMSQHEYLPGYNILTIQTLPVYDLSGELIQANQVGADYYTYSIESKPFAYNGMSDFRVHTLQSNSELFVPGFANSEIFAVDTINNLFAKIDSRAGFFAAVTANYAKSLVSIHLNNEKVFCENRHGFYIAYMSGDDNIIAEFFESPDNDAANYLKQIPENAFFVVAFNSDEKPAQGVIDFFTELGSSEIINVDAHQQWVAYGILKQTYEEKYNSAGTAYISGFTFDSNGNNYQAELKLSSGYSSNLILNDAGSIEKVKVEPVNSTNLKSQDNQADMLVLTHKNFLNSAHKYAEYRQKTNPGLNILVLDVDDIHKEFTYGKKTPHAYKDFFKYALDNWRSPKMKYVLLWGDASWDVRKIEKNSVNEDFVSSFGWPASDYWYVLLDDDRMPDFQISRIPINTDADGLAYIDKLVLNDTIDNKPWMKKFLMLTGGQTEDEMTRFYNYGKYNFLEDNVVNTDLCADTAMVSKAAAGNSSQSQGGEIQAQINEGVQWVYFVGHGSTRVFDLDGWQASKLNNKGKYGYLSTLACNTAAFAEPNIQTRSEEYVIEKDKAFIGSGGSAAVSWETVSISFGVYMLQALNNKENTAETYLDAVWYAKSRMVNSIEERLTADHFAYFGDPLAKLKIQRKPDFYLIKNDVDIKNTRNTRLFIVNDTMNISSKLYNLGHRFYSQIPIKLYHEYKDKTDTMTTTLYGNCYPSDFGFVISLNDNPGLHSFKIVIDPDNTTGDINTVNNTYTFKRFVYNNAIMPLDPLTFWNVNYKDLHFRIINPLGNQAEYKYRFKIFESADTAVKAIAESADSEITISEDYIDWKPDIKLEQLKNYWLGIITVKSDNNSISPISLIPFNTMNNDTKGHVSLMINDAAHFLLSGERKNTSVMLENSESGILLTEEPIDYRIYSIYGSPRNPDRDAEIMYDGTVYITVPPDILGFKLVAVSSDSMSAYAVRNYNTYNQLDQAEQFVRFIKDTVNTGDYLLLTTSGESIRAFDELKLHNPTSIGSLDSLKFYMKNYYGSKIADSFHKEMGSYCLIGRKLVNPDSTRESINSENDTAMVKGKIINYSKNGYYLSADLGPALKWNYIKTSINLDEHASITMKISGYNVETAQYDSLKQLSLADGLNNINLSFVDAKLYPKIKLLFNLSRTREISKPLLKSVSADFVPVPELLISTSSSFLEKDTILRGENMQVNLSVKNASLRTASPETDLFVKVESESKPISEIDAIIPELSVDSGELVVTKEISDNYDLKNTINCYLNPDNIPFELYDFNNHALFTQYMIEDTEKPRIVLKLDGKEIAEGDYVSRVPYIEVELYDNSPLEINQPEFIGIGINRPFPGKYDTVFTSYKRDVPLKAKLAFYSDTLDFGENYYRVIVFDAAGNSDTLTRKVFVAKNGTIDDLLAYPNPFNDVVNIKFNIITPDNEGNITLQIYNQLGQLIKTLKLNEIHVGENAFIWDGRDESGAVQPSGFYAYIIFVNSTIYIEPATGKIILCR